MTTRTVHHPQDYKTRNVVGGVAVIIFEVDGIQVQHSILKEMKLHWITWRNACFRKKREGELDHRWLQGSHYPLSVSWRFSMSGIKCHAAANGKILRNIADSTPFFNSEESTVIQDPWFVMKFAFWKTLTMQGFFRRFQAAKSAMIRKKGQPKKESTRKQLTMAYCCCCGLFSVVVFWMANLYSFCRSCNIFFNNLRLGIFQPAVEMRCIAEPNCWASHLICFAFIVR